MSRFPRLFLPSLAAILIATLFTAGCGDSSHAMLRVVHASPDAPNVDVLANGHKVLSNVAYATASGYLKVDAGSEKIEVRATGTSTDAINASVSLAKNTDTTVLAAGLVVNIAPIVLTDDNTAPASGQIKLRLVHASPGAGNVDIYVEAPGTDITTVGPTLSNVAFGTASSYLAVPAGSYEVYITPTGTKLVAIDSGSLAISAGAIRTAIALDAPGGGAPFSAIVLNDLN
jgi:hypothetical protein